MPSVFSQCDQTHPPNLPILTSNSVVCSVDENDASHPITAMAIPSIATAMLVPIAGEVLRAIVPAYNCYNREFEQIWIIWKQLFWCDDYVGHDSVGISLTTMYSSPFPDHTQHSRLAFSFWADFFLFSSFTRLPWLVCQSGRWLEVIALVGIVRHIGKDTVTALNGVLQGRYCEEHWKQSCIVKTMWQSYSILWWVRKMPLYFLWI